MNTEKVYCKNCKWNIENFSIYNEYSDTLYSRERSIQNNEGDCRLYSPKEEKNEARQK